MPVLRIWGAALALVVLAIAFLETAPDTRSVSQGARASAPIAVIGSSLVLYAIPHSGQNLLGDGRAHARLAVSKMSEEELMSDTESVIDGWHPRVLLIEIDPLVRDLAHETEPQAGTSGLLSFAEWLQSRSLALRLGIKGALRRTNTASVGDYGLADDLLIDAPYQITPEKLSFYPFTLHPPRQGARLARLIARARATGAEVWFLVPPTSNFALHYRGTAAIAAQTALVWATARDYGVPLLGQPEIWPDRLFVDNGHLNRAGRQRYVAQLRAAWALHHGG